MNTLKDENPEKLKKIMSKYFYYILEKKLLMMLDNYHWQEICIESRSVSKNLGKEEDRDPNEEEIEGVWRLKGFKGLVG